MACPDLLRAAQSLLASSSQQTNQQSQYSERWFNIWAHILFNGVIKVSLASVSAADTWSFGVFFFFFPVPAFVSPTMTQETQIRSWVWDGDTWLHSCPPPFLSKWNMFASFSKRVDCGCHADKCNRVSHHVHFDLVRRNSQEASPLKENAGALMPCQRLHFWKIRFSWQIQEEESLAIIKKYLPRSITKVMHAWH